MKNRNYLRFVLIIFITGILLMTVACYSLSFKDVSEDTDRETYNIMKEIANDTIIKNTEMTGASGFDPMSDIGGDSSGSIIDSNDNNDIDCTSDDDEEEIYLPWENGGKTPDQYTWEELEALSNIQKEYFFEWFESSKAYEDWFNNVKPIDDTESIPWENGGKTPDQYTWEELEALSNIQKEYFFEWFESSKAYEDWFNNAKPIE